MIKRDIIDQLVKRTGLSQSQATHAVEETVNILADALVKEEEIFLRGFATIKTVQRAAKPARDINSGTQIMLPPCKTVKLIPSAVLKTRINSNK